MSRRLLAPCAKVGDRVLRRAAIGGLVSTPTLNSRMYISKHRISPVALEHNPKGYCRCVECGEKRGQRPAPGQRTRVKRSESCQQSTQIREISHSLTDRWSLRAHVWLRKHRADFDGEIRENLPPEQAQHAVDLLIGCGPGSLTHDVLAEARCAKLCTGYKFV